MIKNPQLIIRKTLRKSARAMARAADSLVARKYLKRAGVGRAERLFSYTSTRELEALLQLALACPEGANALEIGSHFGKSACYLASGLATKKGHLYCVDTWQNEAMPEGESDTFYEFQRNTESIKEILTIVRINSVSLSSTKLSVPLHLVFIDGDHKYKAVKNDFETIAPWVADDGVIAFHDCLSYEGVSRVIGEVLASGEWMMLGHVENLLWVGRAGFSQ